MSAAELVEMSVAESAVVSALALVDLLVAELVVGLVAESVIESAAGLVAELAPD